MSRSFVAALLLVAAPLHAQSATRGAPAAPAACTEMRLLGMVLMGRFEPDTPPGGEGGFVTEPGVLSILPEGRAAGHVRPEDVIVSIDGHLITTRAGAQRLWHPRTADIRLVVRRTGRQIALTIPSSRCTVQGILEADRRARTVALPRALDSVNRRSDAPSPSRDLKFSDLRTDSIRRTPADTGRRVVLPNGDTVRVIDASSLPRHGVAPAAKVREILLDSVRVADHPAPARPKAVPADSSTYRKMIDAVPVERLSEVLRDSTARFVRGTPAGDVEVFDVKGQRVDRLVERAVIGGLGTGWLGFGLDCRDCTSRMQDGVRVWRFRAPPVVAGIEPGSPAELAGIRIGDVLRAIDGASLETDRGAERFSTLRAGERVRLRLERGGAARDVLITATRRPGAT